MEMENRIKNVAGEKVYITRGIFDYFDEKNFTRLLDEYKFAKSQRAKFYIGLYSNALLEKSGIPRPLKDKVTDQDRINMLEALDFVDGAFLVRQLDKRTIESDLELRILQQRNTPRESDDPIKRFKIGYASGGFSNLHKGHIEHLKEMKKQCKTTVVAVNSDRLIQEYKHKNSSVDENMRRQILSHIRYVDMAIITDDYDKLKALEAVRKLCGKEFDAIFAGSDWLGDPKWIEFEKKLNEMGIQVVFTDRPQNGISTTAIDGAKKGKKQPPRNR